MSELVHEESLPLRGLHALAPSAWRALVFCVVLLAVYVAAGRYLVTQIPTLRDPILRQINAQLPFDVSVEALSGAWMAFSPELSFTGLRVTQKGATTPPILIGRGALRLDVSASLLAGSLQLSRLEVGGLALDAQVSDDGAIEIVGFTGGDGAALKSWLEAFLPNVERVSLKDNQLRLATPDGSIALALNLLLERDGNARRLHGLVEGDNISLAVNAEGVGNPLRPLSWAGDIYIDAGSSNLAALSGVWSSLDLPFRLAGAAHAQFWLARADGDSTARMRWESDALQLDEPGGAWSLPVDALTFEAALEQRARHWSLLTEDFHIERAGQALDLNRVQFDWWGQALRIRASEVGLAALPTLLAAAPGLPPGLREVLPALAPEGSLRSVELRLDDLASPGSSWRLRSAIENLSVSSWNNTPALTGVTGYLELEPGAGQLKLDAQRFSMHYPSVYREPLRYDDAVGDIFFKWDAEALRIDSGLMQLAGGEGEARALLAVDVPFSERVTGVELELLIGMQDSDVKDRNKYLPYTLPNPLRDWLDRSIVKGTVARAGFIWRGSTKRDNAPHRTVQLFLHTPDATLNYDPAWPVLTDVDSTVWLDDRQSWARASRASSGSVRLQDLMVRVLPASLGVQLDIAGTLAAPAAALGDFLRDTPLRDISRGVFSDWTFDGSIAGDLALSLAIGSESTEPDVALRLALDNVTTEVAQIDLPVSALNGELRFRSDAGFAGSKLYGEALNGTFMLSNLTGSPSGLDLALTGEFDVAAVAAWLEQPLLNFASGRAQVSGELLLGDADEAGFSLVSDLLGVTLDAPRPFAKPPDQPLSLSLKGPLSVDPVLDLQLGERLHMLFALADGELDQLAALVGSGVPDRASCDSQLCLSGSVSSLDLTDWSDFYRRYVESSESDAVPLSYQIDSLEIAELRVSARNLGRARVDLSGVGSLWQGAIESASLQGSLTRKDGDLHLLVEDLDLNRFRDGESVTLEQALDVLPSMRVDVLDLRAGDRRIGNLGFTLDTAQPDGALHARDIQGQVWDLQLDASQPAMLRWFGTDAGELTALEVDASYGDFGQVMSAAGFAPTLESESGDLSLRLQWPGPPSNFSVVAADGSVDIAAYNGRLLESGPGALSMISFLNFAEILRGLSMTHMFESGIPFVTASTELYLQSGTLEIADLHIDGAASAFAFTGLSNLDTRSIDGELRVTLPVANNLPWVAALAAGPAVAAGVFVVSKVFEKQVNLMSSAIYEVSGDIETPTVKFRRLFDNKLTPTSEAPEGSGTGGG